MKDKGRAANGFLPAAVLACALFADLGHAGQWSRPGFGPLFPDLPAAPARRACRTDAPP